VAVIAVEDSPVTEPRRTLIDYLGAALRLSPTQAAGVLSTVSSTFEASAR
jgi:hypothetical protein